MKHYFIGITLFFFCSALNAQSVRLLSEGYFSNSAINGAYCPNSQDDEVGSGGYDFNGGVTFEQESTWRIETTPESSTLYLDVAFSFTGTRNTNAFVRGRRSLKIYTQEGNINSIVGFRQVRDNFRGYTRWLNTATGNSSWTGDGDGGLFCEDDNEPDIEGEFGGGNIRDGIFFSMDIQGDTGGSDISTDRDCGCDTRVLKIYWKRNIQIAIATDRDRDGIQDLPYFTELPVDENVEPNQTTARLTIEMSGNDIAAAIHNDDCKRFNGTIRVAIVNENTNRRYPIVGSDVLVNWSNGNRRRDYIFRDLANVQSSKVFYNVPRADIENGRVALILVGGDLKECHKNCGICSDYRCDVYYANSREIVLNSFTNNSGTNSLIANAQIDSNYPNNDNHFIRLPIKVSY